MTKEKYEQTYWEAREVLYRRGKELGKPREVPEGFRRCPVDGVPLSDRELFIEAWGANLAEEILRARIEADSPSLLCEECDQLWRNYTEATGQHLRSLIEIHTNRCVDAINFVTLDLVVRQSAEMRRKARQAVRDHAASHESPRLCA